MLYNGCIFIYLKLVLGIQYDDLVNTFMLIDYYLSFSKILRLLSSAWHWGTGNREQLRILCKDNFSLTWWRKRAESDHWRIITDRNICYLTLLLLLLKVLKEGHPKELKKIRVCLSLRSILIFLFVCFEKTLLVF